MPQRREDMEMSFCKFENKYISFYHDIAANWKEMFKPAIFLLLTLLLLDCKGPVSKDDGSGTDAAQKMEILVDGSKKTLDTEPILSSAYTGAHLILGYLSDKDDFQCTISAYMPVLNIGSYQVYDCLSNPECDENVPDNNQEAMLGPYPKDQVTPSLFRTAYYAPKLGLKPLTLIVTSIAEEQQAGNPFKTRRIKGKFSGTLAYVERQPSDNDLYIVGKTTRVDGTFDLLCSMR